VTVPTRRPKSR